jgi:hypothetical protein
LVSRTIQTKIEAAVNKKIKKIRDRKGIEQELLFRDKESSEVTRLER